MTESCYKFAMSIVCKMKKISAENRETEKCNYDLSARVNVNLSVEEIDYIAYCIEKEILKND